MRTTKSAKLAAHRLAEALPGIATVERQVVLSDQGLHFSTHSWVENLGILADLARAKGWTPEEAWEAARYQPNQTAKGMVVRDHGWYSQSVRWLLTGHPTLSPAPLS